MPLLKAVGGIQTQASPHKGHLKPLTPLLHTLWDMVLQKPPFSL